MREMTEQPETTDPTVSQPFPELVERAIGQFGRPLGWMWDRGFRFLFVLDAIALFGSMVLINLMRFGWT